MRSTTSIASFPLSTSTERASSLNDCSSLKTDCSLPLPSAFATNPTLTSNLHWRQPSKICTYSSIALRTSPSTTLLSFSFTTALRRFRSIFWTRRWGESSRSSILTRSNKRIMIRACWGVPSHSIKTTKMSNLTHSLRCWEMMDKPLTESESTKWMKAAPQLIVT